MVRGSNVGPDKKKKKKKEKDFVDSKQEIWLLLGVCVCSECGLSVCGGQSSVAHEKVLGRTPVDSGQPQTPSGVQRRQKNCDHRRFFGVLSVKKLSSQQTP